MNSNGAMDADARGPDKPAASSLALRVAGWVRFSHPRSLDWSCNISVHVGTVRQRRTFVSPTSVHLLKYLRGHMAACLPDTPILRKVPLMIVKSGGTPFEPSPRELCSAFRRKLGSREAQQRHGALSKAVAGFTGGHRDAGATRAAQLRSETDSLRRGHWWSTHFAG